VHGIAGRKKENKHSSARFAQTGQHLPPVKSRKHHVKNDEVDIDFHGQVQTFQAICGNIDDIAGLAESSFEELGSFYFVFDYQDLHCQPI
jgi:hypothetical protein